MPKGIIIFGSSGSGKTTLGREVAKRLSFPYYDIDDYVWRKDTEVPFSVMYGRDIKIRNLLNAVYSHDEFVMAGSMDSFHEEFDEFFELGVLLTADVQNRLKRVMQREYERFGDRIKEGGDMYEIHKKFLDSVVRYDSDGSPNLKNHTLWAESLGCKVLKLCGDDSVAENAEIIVQEYKKIHK